MTYTPSDPYLVMNRYYIARFSEKPPPTYTVTTTYGQKKTYRWPWFEPWIQEISQEAFDKGRFKENAVVIDADCKRYDVIGAKITGMYRNWTNLFGLTRHKDLKFEFILGEPTQLTFAAAREEVVDLICSRRWAGQTGGTPKQFRESRAECKDMTELINGIAYYGQWPFY